MVWSAARPTPVRRALALVAGAATVFGLVACSGDDGASKAAEAPSESITVDTELAASQKLLDSADAVVVSADDEDSQRRAAGIAVSSGVPMLVQQGSDASSVAEEIERLGAETVVTVGDADVAAEGERTVVAAPEDLDGLKKLTGVEFEAAEDEDEPARAVTEMDAAKPTVPEVDGGDAEEQSGDASDALASAKPASPKTGDGDPLAFAAPGTPLGAIATARAAGLEVAWLPIGDARATSESIEAARAGRTLIGLGDAFGGDDKFAGSVELAADEDIEELPGGGQLVFPGRHMIATYGHPGAPVLGVMGEETPEEAVTHAKQLVEEYQGLTGDKVIPAFEIIASVAQASPGPRNDYSEPAPIEALKPYVDAMTEAGGYVIIDLQPGRADFVDQAKYYEELLKLPNVGLALDPEWKLTPDGLPNVAVGHVQAEEVNRVIDYLADLTAENNLPQKVLMLHQFQLQMLRDRETIDLSRPELAVVLHADGHGTPEQKFETWNVMRQDLQPEIFMAWKNFIDEDQPMFTPEQTMDIEPRPWIVTYQ
ncbi:hypothetical protein HMPREF1650_09485 [Corynebacterium freneyi DNF00450]|uniref:Lipoprotein n=1 Tax=Corynebacterium freneyi DNF00450 TaxID=1287475 RepID=A0A095ZB88_9CORY|nr:hypothetical protein HMPREF1650_09485 [Corynebacterium freneyi DNF00450]